MGIPGGGVISTDTAPASAYWLNGGAAGSGWLISRVRVLAQAVRLTNANKEQSRRMKVPCEKVFFVVVISCTVVPHQYPPAQVRIRRQRRFIFQYGISNFPLTTRPYTTSPICPFTNASLRALGHCFICHSSCMACCLSAAG